MPRKRDYNAVMKPRKHSNKLNVSLIFSTGDVDDFKSNQELSDALSICSRSTTHTDTLKSGISYRSSPPYSPSSPNFPETPTTPQEAWGTTSRSSISSCGIPFGPRPDTDKQYSTENIYDSLAPKKPDVSRSTSEVSSVFLSNSSSSLPLPAPVLDPTTPTNTATFEWEASTMRQKSKDTAVPIMRPQRDQPQEQQGESPFSKLQKATLKKRKTPKKNGDEVTVMTPKREQFNNGPRTTPPSSRHNSISKQEDITPGTSKTRTSSDSSRNSGEFKSRTLPRRLADNRKTSDPKLQRSPSEIPTPPLRTSSRRSSDSRNGDNRTLGRTSRQSSIRKPSRPNSLMETSADPVPLIVLESHKPETRVEKVEKNESVQQKKVSSFEDENVMNPMNKEHTMKKDSTLKRNGTLKKQKKKTVETEKKEEPVKKLESEKENDKNKENGKVLDGNEEIDQQIAHFKIRCDSKVIYNDFEEMEALLMEQESLAEKLEKERQEKVELEKIKAEQDQKQEEMKGTIKNLEEEIVNVDCQMLKLQVANDEFDDELEDHKRTLHARLIQERGKQRQMDDLISLSGMSVYSENGLMLNQDIGDYSKRELLEQIRRLKKEKSELETRMKQLRCDSANEKRKQDKVIKDLMTQIRGFHMPVQRQESSGPQETMALISDLKSHLEQLKSQNKSQTKLIERLVTERNHHLVEIARLKGNVEESIQLKEEVS